MKKANLYELMTTWDYLWVEIVWLVNVLELQFGHQTCGSQALCLDAVEYISKIYDTFLKIHECGWITYLLHQ